MRNPIQRSHNPLDRLIRLLLFVATLFIAQPCSSAEVNPDLLHLAVQGRWEAMLDLLAPEQALKSTSPVDAVLVGHACIMGNRNSEAFALFRRFEAAGPEELRSWVTTAKAIADDNPTSAAASYLLADALLRQQPPGAFLRHDKAGRHPAWVPIDHALKIDADFAPALLLRAVLLGQEYLATLNVSNGTPDAAEAAFKTANAMWKRTAQQTGWPETHEDGFAEALSSLGTLYVQAGVRDEESESALIEALTISPKYLPAEDALASMRVLKNSTSSLAQAVKDLNDNAAQGSPVSAVNLFRLIRAEEIAGLSNPEDPTILATDVLDFQGLVKKSQDKGEPIHVLVGRALVSHKFNEELAELNHHLSDADFPLRIARQIEAKREQSSPSGELQLLLKDPKAEPSLLNRLLLEWFYSEIAPHKRTIGMSYQGIIPGVPGLASIDAQMGGNSWTKTITNSNPMTGITSLQTTAFQSSHYQIGGVSLQQPKQLSHVPTQFNYWGLWFAEPIIADSPREAGNDSH